MNRISENQISMDGAATEILERAGAIVRCESCDDILDNFDTQALTEAYRIANSMITKGDKLVEVFNGDSKALIQRIDSVYADVDSKCHCKKVQEKG